MRVLDLLGSGAAPAGRWVGPCDSCVGPSLLVALAAAVGFPAAAPADAAVTRSNGVVSDLTWYISRADMDRSITLMRDAGVKWIRANINWASVEPNTKGTLDAWWLAEIDYAVTKAQAAGIQILMPIADGVPYWASADPKRYADGSGKHWNKYWKPANFQNYADFAKKIVTRYQAQGRARLRGVERAELLALLAVGSERGRLHQAAQGRLPRHQGRPTRRRRCSWAG